MSGLDELIQEHCPNGVEYRNLDDCCNILDKKRKPVTKSAREAGEYPYYGANGIQDYVSEYIFDGTFVLVGEDGSVLTPEGTPVVNWAEGKIWVNNHAHIIEEAKGVLLRYLYHYLQTVDVRDLIHGNIPKLTQRDFKQLRIPVPPLPVQREIVRILDDFTGLVAELAAELTAREKQYEYYRNALLNFNGCGVAFDFVWRTLGEVAEVGTGSSNGNEAVDDGAYPFFVRSQTIKSKDDYEYDEEAIIIPGEGGIGEIFHYVNGKYALHQRVYRIHFKTEDINTKFAYYYMQTHFKSFILKKAVNGTVASIRKPMIEGFSIPVLPLPTQNEIVHALDYFNALCTDLTSGLPAEIEARQKQYQYYRGKLLTFSPAE